jgi:hypothetical protein
VEARRDSRVNLLWEGSALSFVAIREPVDIVK